MKSDFLQIKERRRMKKRREMEEDLKRGQEYPSGILHFNKYGKGSHSIREIERMKENLFIASIQKRDLKEHKCAWRSSLFSSSFFIILMMLVTWWFAGVYKLSVKWMNESFELPASMFKPLLLLFMFLSFFLFISLLIPFITCYLVDSPPTDPQMIPSYSLFHLLPFLYPSTRPPFKLIPLFL